MFNISLPRTTIGCHVSVFAEFQRCQICSEFLHPFQDLFLNFCEVDTSKASGIICEMCAALKYFYPINLSPQSIVISNKKKIGMFSNSIFQIPFPIMNLLRAVYEHPKEYISRKSLFSRLHFNRYNDLQPLETHIFHGSLDKNLLMSERFYNCFDIVQGEKEITGNSLLINLLHLYKVKHKTYNNVKYFISAQIGRFNQSEKSHMINLYFFQYRLDTDTHHFESQIKHFFKTLHNQWLILPKVFNHLYKIKLPCPMQPFSINYIVNDATLLLYIADYNNLWRLCRPCHRDQFLYFDILEECGDCIFQNCITGFCRSPSKDCLSNKELCRCKCFCSHILPNYEMSIL